MTAKLLPLISRSHIYVEPYGGAASILFAKEPTPVEVYNDLDGGLVNLFRCLQNPVLFGKLKHRLLHTLYSLDEFRLALDTLKDPDALKEDRAWAFFVACNQGFSGIANHEGNWGRAFLSKGGMADTTNKWLMRLSMLGDWHRRIAKVQIDAKCALEVIRYWDSPDTCFYLDPPYVLSTRKAGSVNMYAVEQPNDHHRELVNLLLSIQGSAVLSGYDSDIYRPLDNAPGWERFELKTACSTVGRTRGSGLQGKGAALAKVPRTEVVWRKAVSNQQQLRLEI